MSEREKEEREREREKKREKERKRASAGTLNVTNLRKLSLLAELKSWTRLFAFYLALMLFKKAFMSLRIFPGYG